VATRLRAERQSRGWKLWQVAHHIGVTSATLSRIERQACNPSFETLTRLEELYGLTRKELFEEVYSPREAIKDG
jgi:transcriptional regulator with XRE-family HTH domain